MGEKDVERKKIFEGIFDERTLFALTKLISNKMIEVVDFPISTGKEADVYRARRKNKLIALKIYRRATSQFRDLRRYVQGDPRFEGLRRADIVELWAQKEHKNLQRLVDAGVCVPKPIACERNILAMEYIGNEQRPAPMLRQVKLKNSDKIFEHLINEMGKAYRKANLVHADFSEYNVLISRQVVIIDVGQAVLLEHPEAELFLERDVNNLLRYFARFGVKDSRDKVLERIKCST